METTKILILEDDMIIAADLSLHLTRMGYEVMGILPRGEDAVTQLKDNPPDILLVDIQLKGQLDGVETAHLVNELDLGVILIYLTANADDATFDRAKATQPSAFITKPFKRRDLERAIELAILQRQQSPLEASALTTSERVDEQRAYLLDDRIFVKYRDRMVKLYLSDILYVEAERTYCKIYTAEKEYLMTLSLKAFQSKLSAQSFQRVHRSYIANLTKVDALSDNCDYLSIGRQHIPVSKSYKEQLINRLKLI